MTPAPQQAQARTAGDTKRPTPFWLRTCYALFITLPLAVMGAELVDADAVLDDLPAGLMLLLVALWLIALGIVALDLVLSRIDRRAQRSPRG